jgi:HK97 family phage major capsid protein
VNTRALITERVELNEKARGILDRADRENRSLTAEEQTTFDRMQTRIGELKGLLDAHSLVDAEERELGESRGRKTGLALRSRGEGLERASVPNLGWQRFDSTEHKAFRAWALGSRASSSMLEAAAELGLQAAAPELDLATFEKRALSVGTTTAGGNAVPNEMMRSYYEAQKWFGRIRETSTIITTETGAVLPMPTVDDTANTGEVVAEGASFTTTVDPSFGVVNLTTFKFSSKTVVVSWELLQDSFIDPAVYLGSALGRRVGRINNTKFTTGAGTTEPKGIITAASAGVTSATTNGFVADDVITLVHSVDPAYRGAPGTGFMLHDTVAMYVRKMKDGQGRYLWEMSTQLGQPDRLFGFPVSINNDMDSAFTTAKKLIAFGYLPAYTIRDAGQPTFIRLNELYAANGQTGFMVWQRSDGNLLDATAVKYLRLA